MDTSSVERLRSTLIDYLQTQVNALAVPKESDDDLLMDVRRLCSITHSARSAFEKPSDLIAQLRETPVVLPVPGGNAEFAFRFWRDLHTIASGGWERHNLRLLQRVLRPGDQVIDVGAHVGHFTVYASHLVGATGRVVAVEPAPANFAVLQANLGRNRLEGIAQAIQVAVSDNNGSCEFFDDGGTAGTEYSLYPQRHGGTGVAFRAEVVTLDRLAAEHSLNRVRLVKIDAEGAELAVLRGAEEILRGEDTMILVELHPWVVSPRDVGEFLESRGYRLFEVSDALSPLSAVQMPSHAKGRMGDVLATRHPLPA